MGFEFPPIFCVCIFLLLHFCYSTSRGSQRKHSGEGTLFPFGKHVWVCVVGEITLSGHQAKWRWNLLCRAAAAEQSWSIILQLINKNSPSRVTENEWNGTERRKNGRRIKEKSLGGAGERKSRREEERRRREKERRMKRVNGRGVDTRM